MSGIKKFLMTGQTGKIGKHIANHSTITKSVIRNYLYNCEWNPNEELLNATRTPRNPKWYERYGKNRKNSKKY